MTEMSYEDAINNFLYDPESGDLYMPKRYGDKPLSGKCTGGYIRVFFNGKRYKAHRIIMLMINGVWPDQVDHENHNRSDNRWSNLNTSDYKSNSKNRSLNSRNKSGVCGVSYNQKEKKWRAQVVVNGRHVLCERFLEQKDAIKAVQQARQNFNFHQNHGV